MHFAWGNSIHRWTSCFRRTSMENIGKLWRTDSTQAYAVSVHSLTNHTHTHKKRSYKCEWGIKKKLKRYQKKLPKKQEKLKDQKKIKSPNHGLCGWNLNCLDATTSQTRDQKKRCIFFDTDFFFDTCFSLSGCRRYEKSKMLLWAM